MQQRQDDVDLAELLGHAAGLEDGQAALGRVAGEHDGGTRPVDLGQLAAGDRELLRVVAGQHPSALAGDADRHDVEPLAGR